MDQPCFLAVFVELNVWLVWLPPPSNDLQMNVQSDGETAPDEAVDTWVDGIPGDFL